MKNHGIFLTIRMDRATAKRRALRAWLPAAACLALVAGVSAPLEAQQAGAAASGKLQIYFIDVEGGQSTLFVSPDKHSLLIDTGWPGNGGRDADRIAQAAKQAGITEIGTVLLTHFHVDHTGGVPQLVAKIPVGTFIDHGPNRESSDAATEAAYEGYQKVLATGKYQHITAKVGQVLPVLGPEIKVKVLSADGALIDKPLPGAGAQNPYCAQSETRPPDQTENARSLGVEITFGKLRILDLGDLTWDKEMEMMCPVNRIGRVDLLVVSHHGWNQSSSPALVDAIQPQVAVMDNGAKKGGSKPTVETIRAIPGLKAEYQLHYSEEAGADNPPEAFLANLQGPDTGIGILVTADAAGNLAVTNQRTGATTPYPAR
ncbi:MAG TPA: MBL fold metallo-hydrolase [Acidobacteriaceae bacterium]